MVGICGELDVGFDTSSLRTCSLHCRVCKWERNPKWFMVNTAQDLIRRTYAFAAYTFASANGSINRQSTHCERFGSVAGTLLSNAQSDSGNGLIVPRYHLRSQFIAPSTHKSMHDHFSIEKKPASASTRVVQEQNTPPRSYSGLRLSMNQLRQAIK